MKIYTIIHDVDILTDKTKNLYRKADRVSIVLLKNSENILSIDNNKHQIFRTIKKFQLLEIMKKVL
jgi:hypothetical protein